MTIKNPGTELERETIASILRLTRRWLLVVPLSKGEAARDGDGNPVCPLVRSAKAFCLQGLIIRCCPDIESATFRLLMQMLHQAVRKLTRGQHDTLFGLVDDPSTTRVTLVRLVDEVLDQEGQRVARAGVGVAATSGAQARSNGRITA